MHWNLDSFDKTFALSSSSSDHLTGIRSAKHDFPWPHIRIAKYCELHETVNVNCMYIVHHFRYICNTYDPMKLNFVYIIQKWENHAIWKAQNHRNEWFLINTTWKLVDFFHLTLTYILNIFLNWSIVGGLFFFFFGADAIFNDSPMDWHYAVIIIIIVPFILRQDIA